MRIVINHHKDIVFPAQTKGTKQPVSDNARIVVK
jgi:hypothetical protein